MNNKHVFVLYLENQKKAHMIFENRLSMEYYRENNLKDIQHFYEIKPLIETTRLGLFPTKFKFTELNQFEEKLI